RRPWSGTGMMLTEPITEDFGDPTGGCGVLGPAPRPRAFETYSVLPSRLTASAAGHQPVGMWPRTLPSRTTATAFRPASATYSVLLSGESANATGCTPRSRLSAPVSGESAMRATCSPFRKTATESSFPLATYTTPLPTAMAFGWGPA